MPRDLGDVLHYFMPELERTSAEEPHRSAPRRERRPAALAIVAVPLGERDVVRAAFAWNLVVEAARLGARAALVAPSIAWGAPLWPRPGVGPLGAELILHPARDLGALHRAALDIAVSRAADADDGGVVLVRVPPTWLKEAAAARNLLRWVLLFTSSDSRDLQETYGIAKLLSRSSAEGTLGVTVHGARLRAEAESAFTRLSNTAKRHLGRSLTSYGLLTEDVHVYRAIVAQEPIGLAHPQAPAAKALRDVARMIVDDARKTAVV